MPPKKSKRPKTSPEKAALIKAQYGDKGVAEKKEHFADLPRWVRLALAEYVTQELTQAEVAKRHNRSLKTFEKYAQSPAGKAWRAELLKVMDDPMRLGETMMRATAANVTVDYLMALQEAIDQRDYKEVGVMSRDLLDRLGMTKKDAKSAQKSAQPTIVINLGGGLSLDRAMVETSFEGGEDFSETESFYEVVGEGEE